ncbi:MAG: Cof-type HAD-IIB family hydrolase [Lactobacillales bacterium]|jgi:Cof subfamily protein (haloacid dehalogenase superfamily)|nr:Cof-type HAD-IIB family hydrolase [Lactobacillales bacterium]
MIKLIAIDLDGTLLNSAKTISPRNIEALKKAEAQGVKVVITTGRPLAMIEPYIEAIGSHKEDDYSITFNGGLVQRNLSGEILAKRLMTREEVDDIARLARELDLPMDVLSEANVLQLPTSQNLESLYGLANPYLNFIQDVKLDDWKIFNKAVMTDEPARLDEKIAKIPQEYRDRYEVIKSRDMLLEFMSRGITKASGLEMLRKILGIEISEIMSLGDEENDLNMIEYAGLGVAMGNAVETVKQAADVVMEMTNDEDAVAIAVERFVLQ